MSNAIRLTGQVTWRSLMNALKRSFGNASGPFRPARQSVDDPYQLGTEVIPATFRPLEFQGTESISAECAVGLAILAHRGRGHDSVAPLIRLSRESERAPLEEAGFGIGESLTVDESGQTPWVWERHSTGRMIRLRCCILNGRTDVHQIARSLSDALVAVLPTDHYDRPSTLGDTLELLSGEALLNVWEHAYGASQPARAYVCATLSLPGTRRASAAGAESGLEARWLSEHMEDEVLELVIGDAGVGIPRTLWSFAQNQLLLPPTAGWNVASRKGRTDRARLHQELLHLAFRHDSTRKRPESFRSVAEQLNWRGLHRCANAIAGVSGAVVLCSGQGRTGRLTIAKRTEWVVPPEKSDFELPGTMVLTRVHLTQEASQRRMVVPRGTVDVGTVRDASSQHAAICTAISERSDRQSSTEAVLFPFRRDLQAIHLAEAILEAPPDHVNVVLFADVKHSVLSQLQAIGKADFADPSALPRIVVVWSPTDLALHTTLLGSVNCSPALESVIRTLLENGLAEVTEDCQAGDRTILRDLAAAHQELFHYDESGEVRLDLRPSFAAPSTFSECLQLAFDKFWRESAKDDAMFVAPPGAAIRLPTGRLVSRFISALRLLRQYPVLARALSQRLHEVLNAHGCGRSDVIIADSPASYFVAARLMRDLPEAPFLMPPGRIHARESSQAVLLFTDVTSRGESVEQLVRALEDRGIGARAAIACFDFKAGTRHAARMPIVPLLTVESATSIDVVTPAQTRVYEVDRIDHSVLLSETTKNRLRLGTSPVRDEFLRENPGLIRHGFHKLGGRTHTISLATDLLVEEHGERVTDWLAEEVETLTQTPEFAKEPGDLVLLIRPESAIHHLRRELVDKIRARCAALERILVASITAAPMPARLSFPRDAEQILGDVEEPGLRTLFVEPPNDGFRAILLDDAVLSGRTLRDVATKIAELAQPRAAVLAALTIVNRLNPGEERFIGRFCDAPRGGHRSLRLVLRSLFRLQVHSNSHVFSAAPTMWGGVLHEERRFPLALEQYASAVRMKWAALNQPTGTAEGRAVRHLFYGGAETPQVTSLTYRGAYLRHVLALHEQNEGVASEIHQTLVEAHNDDDASILSVFALEPHLLFLEPVPSECWPLLRSLAARVIGSEAHEALCSDALLVLAQFPRDLLEYVPTVLARRPSNSGLTAQCLLHVLEIWRSHPALRATIQHQLDMSAGGESKEVAELLSDIIAAEQYAGVSSSLADLTGGLHEFLANSWIHDSLEPWTNAATLVSLLEVEQTHERCEMLKAHSGVLARYGHEVILKGIRCLRDIAGAHGDARGRQELDDLYKDAYIALHQFDRAVRAPASNLSIWCQHVTGAWSELQESTFAIPPFRLLGDPGSDAQTPFERRLIQRACDPDQLIRHIARRKNVTLQRELPSEASDARMLVVGVSKGAVSEVLGIVLENVIAHGREPAALVEIRHSTGSLPLELRMRISNLRRDDRISGAGQGWAIIRARAREGGFSAAHSEDGERFIAELSFSDPIIVQPGRQTWARG